MRYVFSALAAIALVGGTASNAKAQFSLSVGNPVAGGVAIRNGFGFGPGGPMTVYSSGYSGFGAMPTIYRSGYFGVAPGFGYGFRPGVYRGFGYPRFSGRYRYGYPRWFGYRGAGRRWRRW
jgi:hypothetical protein